MSSYSLVWRVGYPILSCMYEREGIYRVCRNYGFLLCRVWRLERLLTIVNMDWVEKEFG